MSESSDPNPASQDSADPEIPSDDQSSQSTTDSERSDGDTPVIESRRGRLVAYLRHNWSRMVVDGATLLAWLLGATATFQWFGLPRWLLYVVIFVGVVVYTRVTPTWQRPYRNSDS